MCNETLCVSRFPISGQRSVRYILDFWYSLDVWYTLDFWDLGLMGLGICGILDLCCCGVMAKFPVFGNVPCILDCSMLIGF